MTSSIETELLDPLLVDQIQRHDRALEARDLPFLETLLTDDFTQVPPRPVLRTRSEWFAWFGDVVKYEQMRREIVTARSFADVTVVISECTPLMRVRDGEPSVHVAFMLEVWTNRDGSWRKALEQYTRGPS
jgi:hypothetical protein